MLGLGLELRNSLIVIDLIAFSRKLKLRSASRCVAVITMVTVSGSKKMQVMENEGKGFGNCKLQTI